MKTIKMLVTKKGYFDTYVRMALKPLFKINETEEKVVSLILYHINEELELGVPMDAAIRLTSLYEAKVKIRSEIVVMSKKLGNKKAELKESFMNNVMMNLRKKGILLADNRIKKQFVINYSEGGFSVILTPKKEKDDI